MIKAEHAKRKSGNGAIGYRRILPSIGRNYAAWGYEFGSPLLVQMLHYFGFTIQLVVLRVLT